MADADDSRTAHEAALEALIPAEEREAFDRGVAALVECNQALLEAERAGDE